MSWYYAEEGQQRGPVTDEQFEDLVQRGVVTGTTLVWREGMADWQPYEVIRAGARPASAVPAAMAGAVGAQVAGAGVPGEPESGGVATVERPPEPQPLSFTGDAGEYFKIWIVNLLLTIVTFGIYAAWAKVRTKRYFYANTHLFGHAFEYLADPVRIFIGNLIVVVLFLSLQFASAVSIVAYIGLAVLLTLAAPWFIVRALTFNARNSAWRGLRFRFAGGYGEAFRVFVLLPLLVVVTLGLAYPWVAKLRREWIVNRHAYGSARFSFQGDTGEFYRIYLVGFLFSLPLIAAYFAIVTVAVTAANAEAGGAPPSPLFGLVFLLIFPAFLLAYAGFFYVYVRLFNYSWDNTQIEGHRFRGTMQFWELFGIQISNWILTALTFGLTTPWARVRLARYTASCLHAIPAGSLDTFVAGAQEDVSAVGEAASDIFDLDIGIDFGL